MKFSNELWLNEKIRNILFGKLILIKINFLHLFCYIK